MKFHIIGIDDNDNPRLGSELLELISRSRIFSGGARHRQIISSVLPEGHTWIEITPPMKALFERYAQCTEQHIVVFASGDPLFYGFASTLQRFDPDAEMVIYPTFNSLQTLAHRAQIAYQEMKMVSLTGRSWDRFDEALIEGEELIGVLTDTKAHTPEKIAQRMLKYGYTNYTITVGLLLGNSQNEKIERLSIEDTACGSFLHPCNMILEITQRRERPFGIEDSSFKGLEGRSKMITKKAIRLTLLSMLELRGAKTFWDVGFCTGSVSIESKLQFPHLKVYSFEKREECREIIEHNITKFGAMGIEYFIGDFMECSLEGVTAADAIFIGGHGGNLKEIVKKCHEHLNHGGRLLFNSVSEQSEDLFMEAIGECGMEVSQTTSIRVDEFNRIKIVKTIKR
ncbi:MAG: precorrin-6y C5,15-methyltransferase (decarboxylating) subunit CbiE [Rikenellaceae bacterium]